MTSRPRGTGAPDADAPARNRLVDLPKAHLHLHFTGSMRQHTLLDLARHHDIRLPHAFLEDWPPTLTATDSRGWFRFQRLYDVARACVRGESDMRRILDEAVADDAAEGSRWLEIQIDPTSYAPFVGGLVPAVEIVLDEAAAAADRHGIGVGVIIAASRIRHPLDARTLARLAARYSAAHGGGVVGFGLSNDERRGDTAEFAGAFRIAAHAGLALVPHGGELLGPEAVRRTIEALGPERLGHGVRASEDRALLDEIAERGLTLEVCPTSNVALGVYRSLADVPVPDLLAAGVRVALGADDPLLFGSRLVDQYAAASAALGLDEAALARLARDSLTGSRAPAPLRARALAEVDDWLTGHGRHDGAR